MAGGTNGPPITDGAAFTQPTKTLVSLRNRLIVRTGHAAQLASPPPGLTDLLDDFLIDNQEQLFQRFQSKNMLRWWPISITKGNRHYDIPAISSGALTDVAFADNDPAQDTITRTTGSWLDDGFASEMQVFISGSSKNASEIFTLSTVTALTMTIDGNEKVTTESAGTSVTITTRGFIDLAHTKIEEAWLLDSTIWSPMTEGIYTGRFNETGQAFPQNYEFREHLEIWPDPDKAYTIYLKGNFGLKPFESDSDVTTLPATLIFLFSLADAKAHYGQGDSGVYYRRAELYLAKLNAGKFGNRRYIPNVRVKIPARAYPQTTFVRG